MNTYKLARNTRILIAVFSAGVLVFFAGVSFSGEGLSATNVLIMVLSALNLISFTFSKQTPPKTPSENPPV